MRRRKPVVSQSPALEPIIDTQFQPTATWFALLCQNTTHLDDTTTEFMGYSILINQREQGCLGELTRPAATLRGNWNGERTGLLSAN